MFSNFAAMLPLLAVLAAPVSSALVRVANFGDNPTGLQMNINVPANVTPKPAIVLVLHGCFASGEQYASQTKYNQLSDSQRNFITIFPSSVRDNNCWGVNLPKTLTRDGGGDNQGLKNMIDYTIRTYGADRTKVFITGSSSGCMMTNVMLATYPDYFGAATCYSGVAAGCLAGSPGASPTTADPACANGQVIKSQADWVAQARAMFPSYNGTYPKFATYHGTADTLVRPPNLGEQLKQWSGLLGVQFTRNVTNTPISGYTQQVYGDGTKLLGFIAQGVGHTVPAREVDDLKWFGISTATTAGPRC